LKHNKIIIFILFLILKWFSSIILAQGQTASVSGRAVSVDNSPASFLKITLKSINLSVQSDSSGKFIIDNLPELDDTLVISGVGIKTDEQIIRLSAGQRLDLGIIHLDHTINQLNNVEISDKLPHSYKTDHTYDATKTETALIDIPQAISSVTNDLLKDKMELHLTEVLDNISGLVRYSGYVEYNIRGLHAENPWLIDGLRTFNTWLTSPMLLNVERVEVIKGPVTILYGNADPGGTINLVTKKALQQSKYDLIIGGGSWDGYNVQTDLTGPLNEKKTLLYRLNAGYENRNSFRHGMFLKSFQAAPSLTYIPGEKLKINLDLSLSGTHSAVDRGQPAFENETALNSTPVTLTLIQPGDYLRETDISSVLSAKYVINPNISINSAVLYNLTSQDLSEHYLRSYITNDSVNLGYSNRQATTSTFTMTNYATFAFKTGQIEHLLLTGIDFIASGQESEGWTGAVPSITGEPDPNVGTFSLSHPQYFQRPVSTYEKLQGEGSEEEGEGIYNTGGLYVQDQLTFKKWILLAGLRADIYNSGEEDEAAEEEGSSLFQLIPRIGITYKATENIHFYSTYVKGFDPFEPSVIMMEFSEPFKPVISNMVEAGAKASWRNDNLWTSVSLYQIGLTNTAVNANDLSNPNLYVQRGAERSRGVETEICGNILPNLSVVFNYSFNVAEITNSTVSEEIGRIKENAPRHSSSSWIKYTFNGNRLKGFGFSAGHSQAGLRNTLADGFTLPGYCILNTGFHYEGGKYSVGLNINNIVNSTYWISAYNNVSKWPGEPRNFRISVAYHF
jgi:iron complex outermembrane recepter protein